MEAFPVAVPGALHELSETVDVGLRLDFRLTARGPFVRDDPALVIELLALFRREGLLDDRGATLTIDERDVGDRLSLDQLEQRLQGLPQPPRSLLVQGLRTAEHFPNPFWQYTMNEEVIAAWMSIRHVCQPPAQRLIELSFVEPDFLNDSPSFTPHRLAARLKTVVGTSLTPECTSMETEPASGKGNRSSIEKLNR